jgi:hypothetical protein
MDATNLETTRITKEVLDAVLIEVQIEQDVRDLTYLTPQVGRIIYFHVIKVNINKA